MTNADMMSANDVYAPYTGDGMTKMEAEREHHENRPLMKSF
jgi:hypothetical protein